MHRTAPSIVSGWLVLTTLAALSVGCQSHEAGVQALCDAPQTCGAPCANATPAERMSVLARHVQAEVSNREVLEVFAALGAMDPAERAQTMRDMATQAGVSHCAIVDVFTPSE